MFAGVADSRTHHCWTPATLFEAADIALVEAKLGGSKRARVFVRRPTAWSAQPRDA